MDYAAIEPFGEYRSELRHGQQMAQFANANFKLSQPAKPCDYMNFQTPVEEKKMTPEESFAQIDKEVFGL